MQGFEEFYNRHEFTHFTAKELLVKGASNEDPDSPAFHLNADPPPELWPYIIKTVKVLEWLRREIDEAIFITSAYRSDAYNKAIGGALKSQHKLFTACDIKAATKTPKELYDLLIEYRENGGFVGGIGLYNTFVHVDTRPKNATWDLRTPSTKSTLK